jgi:predicted amidohydrolase
MVCADGRIPEIAGMLRAKGAKLIVDPVNLVAAAATPEQLSNQQYEFILPVRAKENGVFIAAANKCGVEEDIVTCLGRSFVTDPEGNILAECSPDKEEILFAEIDLSDCKEIPEKRPALYEAMVMPAEELPITRDIQAAYTMDELNLFTLIVRYQYGSKEEFTEKALRYIRNGQITSAELIILPELEEEYRLDDALTETVSKALSGNVVVALAGRIQTEQGPARVVRFLTRNGQLGALQSTHCTGTVNADSIEVLSLTPSIKIAALFDEEAEIPEISRTAMLKGADILLCYDGSSTPMRIKTLKTRAAENSIFVIRSAAARGVDTGAIYNPAGGQSLTTLTSEEHAAAGYINTALSKFKSIVPGTHIVHGRIPSFYKKERNHEQ